MESHPLHRDVVAPARRPTGSVWPRLAIALLLVAPRTASAQFEFTGSWNSVGTEDISNDSLPVDYMGLPLNDEGRAKALSYSAATIGMVDHQCEGWPPTYLASGGFGLRITRELEPIKGTTVSYTIDAWSDRPQTVVWMDGRQASKYAVHTRSGFATGKWEGNTLVITTTHMHSGNVRKTGPPMSDQAVMTARYFRHGHVLTMVTILEDPAYWAEPLVWSRSYEASEAEVPPQGLSCITTFEGTTAGEVPHWLPGKNPFINEMTDKFPGIPNEVFLGYAETLYPEYRQKMKATQGR